MDKMMVSQALLACCIMLLVSAPATARQPNLILPGRSVGHVRIGAEVPTSLRSSEFGDGDSAMGRSYGEYRSLHPRGQGRAYALGIFTVRKPENGRSPVGQIRVESPWFMTTNGISTASSLSQIRKRFRHLKVAEVLTQDGTGKQIDVYDDQAAGIAFQIWGKGSQSAGHCAAIFVHRCGQKVEFMGSSFGAWHESR